MGLAPLPSSMTDPRPAWPSAIAQAEIEKLAMRGAGGARPGQIMVSLWDPGPQLPYLSSGPEVPAQAS